MVANDVVLRNLVPAEVAMGCGLLQSRPATSFSPVAVTPDELGGAWRDAKVHLPLRASWNGRLVGQPDAGAGMAFNFAQLIAHLARTRKVRAGTIVGSGALSSGDDAIAAFMRFDDTVRIDMLDENGKSIFGAIDQKVTRSG
jgi:fumarylacetoacetate (FAA) hydrolase